MSHIYVSFERFRELRISYAKKTGVLGLLSGILAPTRPLAVAAIRQIPDGAGPDSMLGHFCNEWQGAIALGIARKT